MMQLKKLVCLMLALTLLPLSAALAEEKNYFTARDLTQDYDANKAAMIQLLDSEIAAGTESVTVSGTTATITAEGVYVLTGTLQNGQVIVDAPKDAKVQLVLDGVTIHSETSAAIYVRQADKVFLTLAAGTENNLSSGDAFEAIDDNNIDAAVFSKDTLTLNGAGALTVASPAGHGVAVKGKLKITGGSVRITAARHGATGKNGVYICDGTLDITAGQDGLHAENDEDTTRGMVVISSGSVRIAANGDGIDAGGTLEITDGDFDIVTGGGSQNAPAHQEERGGRGWFGWQDSASNSAQDTASAKGLKASGSVTLTGGDFTLDCQDDAIHSNADVNIAGGTYQIATGDDGVHADENVAISGGTIVISASYEGIEGQRIEISGGKIDATASDDGLNAAGGDSGDDTRRSFMQSSGNNELIISGGYIVIDAAGDGLDSDGNLTVTGGNVYVYGPESSNNGALDFDGTGTVAGGAVVALGASGMAQNFDDSSSQGSILASCSTQAAGTVVMLLNANGNELISCTAKKSFSSVVISLPEIQSGQTYTLKIGSATQNITMNGLIYGSGFGGFGGGGRWRP